MEAWSKNELDLFKQIAPLVWEKEGKIIDIEEAKIIRNYIDVASVDFKKFCVIFYKDRKEIRIISE